MINETLSAPSASQAFAMSTTLVTLGDNFTISILSYTSLTALTTLAAPDAVTPKAIPPAFTLGQEIFNSMAGMFSNSLIRAAHEA